MEASVTEKMTDLDLFCIWGKSMEMEQMDCDS